MLGASMSARQHKNPPIEEALCEFTFASVVPSAPFDLTLSGRLQLNRLMDEYKGQVRTQNLQTIVMNENAPNIGIQNALFRIQLPTSDGTRLISLGQNTLAISVLRPYEGWENFKPRIDKALQAYWETKSPVSVTRIGLRYINRIITPGLAKEHNRFLVGASARDANIGANLTNFTRREEYIEENGTKILVTQSTLQPVSPDTTEYLLDIDTVWDSESIGDHTRIMATAEQLHDTEGAAFEALITDEARRLFDAD
jgi:uncharacterized protein (TIGR04255 family)